LLQLCAALCVVRHAQHQCIGLDVGAAPQKLCFVDCRMGSSQIVCKSDRYVSMLLLNGSFMIERLRWRVIMADTYTKAVLSVIAAALVLLAAENLVRFAEAQDG
jgi:hypothetical protein